MSQEPVVRSAEASLATLTDIAEASIECGRCLFTMEDAHTVLRLFSAYETAMHGLKQVAENRIAAHYDSPLVDGDPCYTISGKARLAALEALND